MTRAKAPKDSPKEALLAEAFEASRASWPGVSLGRDVYVRHLTERLPDGDWPLEALADLHTADLYLACACVQGDAMALAVFDEEVLARIGSYIGRIDPSPVFVDEVRQTLRTRLLLRAADAPPKLVEYTGKSPLHSWVRVAAVWAARDAKRALRRGGRESLAGGASSVRAANPDPELDYIKVRYRKEFKEIFEKTLAKLPARERNILCLHFLDGMSHAAIAELYKVHETTVSRWITRCREQVLEEIRGKLAARLGISSGEVESLMGIVQSRLDITLSRVLKRKGKQ
jgi:RNA polymerase sigma-70 factor (ECF subfamily)